MENQNPKIWDNHYKKDKSTLYYPDENLVRILSKLNISGKALDHGSGSGRHIQLLKEFGFEVQACDYSIQSIEKIQSRFNDVNVNLIHSTKLPYSNEEFDLIISWGVLHYNSLEDALEIIAEWKRILKKNGFIIGSIRSDKDTHLKIQKNIANLEDLSGSKIKLYSLEEIKLLLQNFTNFELAYMERTPMGKLEERICHWIFQAKN